MKKLISVIFMAVVFIFSGCTPIIAPPSPSLSAEVSSTPSVSPSVLPSPTASVSATPSPSPVMLTAQDYFPFAEDVIMTYAGEGNEYAGFVSHVDYINNGAMQIRTNNGGTESVGVYTIEDGALKKVFTQGETYYMYDYSAERVIEDVMIMEPIAVGTTWTLDSGAQRTITAVAAAITVPYGTFEALEVTTVETGSTMKDYYVLDMGLVKRDFIPDSDPSNPITSELEAVDEGSPLIISARLYYPDFNNDQVAYAEKNIEFYTGDSIESKFEFEFKNIPTGSGLTPLMSPSTSINSLTYDMNTGVVTVDFSETFITQMNAGASLESMILSSVANALGDYFLTNKIQIRIDGGSYMSGHFGFNLGDYLSYNPGSAVAYNP